MVRPSPGHRGGQGRIEPRKARQQYTAAPRPIKSRGCESRIGGALCARSRNTSLGATCGVTILIMKLQPVCRCSSLSTPDTGRDGKTWRYAMGPASGMVFLPHNSSNWDEQIPGCSLILSVGSSPKVMHAFIKRLKAFGRRYQHDQVLFTGRVPV